ncbi:MAG: 4-hydroxy-3-methylbut-2-enyl diphosphate reductase, partial [uncultured Corynebacteriales bacterium]
DPERLRQGPARHPARLLRGRRPGGSDGRAHAGAAGRPGVRAEADRAQPARRPRAGGPGRDLRRGDRRGARGRHRGLLRARGRPGGAPGGGRPRPDHHRRDLPAGHQGAQRGQAVRPRGLRDPPDRSRGARGGRRHRRRGPGGDRPGRRARACRDRAGQGPGQGRLAVPDHAVGGRDAGDGGRPGHPLPRAALAAERRHLLRDAEPAGRGEGDQPAGRAVPGRRVGQLVELGADGRGRPGPRRERRPPGRGRQRDRRGVAGRRAHRRPVQRRVGAGDPGHRRAGLAGRARVRRGRGGHRGRGEAILRPAAGAAPDGDGQGL